MASNPLKTSLGLALGIAAAAALAACAGMERSAGIADWKQVRAQPLAMGENTIEISLAAPSYSFDTGESFYRVLELPAQPRPFKLRLASVLTRSDSGFFHPEILVLDRAKNVVRRIEAPLEGKGLVQLPPFRYIIPGEIEITESPEKAAYLLIRTNRALLKHNVVARGALFVPESGVVASMPSTWTIPAAPTGTLWIDTVAARN